MPLNRFSTIGCLLLRTLALHYVAWHYVTTPCTNVACPGRHTKIGTKRKSSKMQVSCYGRSLFELRQIFGNPSNCSASIVDTHRRRRVDMYVVVVRVCWQRRRCSCRGLTPSGRPSAASSVSSRTVYNNESLLIYRHVPWSVKMLRHANRTKRSVDIDKLQNWVSNEGMQLALN